jgi:hypothetical protein
MSHLIEESLKDKYEVLLQNINSLEDSIRTSKKINEYTKDENVDKYAYVRLEDYIQDGSKLQESLKMHALETVVALRKFLDANAPKLTEKFLDRCTTEITKIKGKFMIQPSMPDFRNATVDNVDTLGQLSDGGETSTALIKMLFESDTIKTESLNAALNKNIKKEEWLLFFNIISYFDMANDQEYTDAATQLKEFLDRNNFTIDDVFVGLAEVISAAVTQTNYIINDLTSGFGGDLYINALVAATSNLGLLGYKLM